jgi:hypothetical protein
MTKISEAAKRKARELLTAEYGIRHPDDWPRHAQEVAERVLARVLQEHSDVAKAYFCTGGATAENLRRAQALILPDEPDPLAAKVTMAMLNGSRNLTSDDACALALSEALTKHGLKIVEADDDLA